MTSAGSMSGVNWRRENLTCMQCGQRFHGERLGQAGHAFEQDVAVGQQADDEPLGQVLLADDDFPQFVKQRVREGARFLDRFVDGVDSCAHVLFSDSTDRWTSESSRSVQADFNHGWTLTNTDWEGG